MTGRASVSRYSLYGEGHSPIAPEFVHIEPISARSSLYEWTISPHAHPGITQLLLLESGAGVLATDGREVALVPPTLVALPSGCIHAFRFASGAEGWVLSIAANLLGDPRIARLCSDAIRDDGRPLWVGLEPDASGARRLSWLLADFSATLAEGRAGALPDLHIAQLAMILALAKSLVAEGEAARHGAGRRDDLARRFRKAVELHFREGWSVVRYAALLGTTAPTLTRACREVWLRAPGEIVLDRLLLEAMRNLTYSTATISQISDDLGFATPAYFARFFKARAGMTASSFRQTRAWLDGGQAG